MDINKKFTELVEGDNSYATIGFPPQNKVIEDDPNKAVDHINAHLVVISGTPTINPYSFLNKVQQCLLEYGFQFDPITPGAFVGESGLLELPLTLFGGRTGFLTTGSNVVSSDDGISHLIGNGLILKLVWIKMRGLYTCDAQIVPVPPISLPNISETTLNLSNPKPQEYLKTLGFKKDKQPLAFKKDNETYVHPTHGSVTFNKDGMWHHHTTLKKPSDIFKLHKSGTGFDELHKHFKSLNESLDNNTNLSDNMDMNESENLRNNVIDKGKKIGIDSFGMGTHYMSHEGNVYAVHSDGKLSNHGPENEFRDKVKNGKIRAKLT